MRPRSSASKGIHSALYEGVVRHCRLCPVKHKFSYRIFMVYLDLCELELVFGKSRWWSLEKFNVASFRRADYLGDENIPLDKAVRDRVEEVTGNRPDGAVRMLTNLRYLGFIINPITCYYCFDEKEQLVAVVAEVTNTPWGERHSYVIPHVQGEARTEYQFAKALHVSPFMSMQLEYKWRSAVPDQRLSIYMENHVDGNRTFNASLHLKRDSISPSNQQRYLWLYPLMTVKIFLAIYWQALKLWLRNVPIIPHPQHTEKAEKETEVENQHLPGA